LKAGDCEGGDYHPPPTPCPKKALDEEKRVLLKEVQEYAPNTEIPFLLKPSNNSGDYTKIPDDIPPVKTFIGYVYDWLVYLSEFFW
jgi:hypothetical protein